jgi:hypothetical protein
MRVNLQGLKQAVNRDNGRKREVKFCCDSETKREVKSAAIRSSEPSSISSFLSSFKDYCWGSQS